MFSVRRSIFSEVDRSITVAALLAKDQYVPPYYTKTCAFFKNSGQNSGVKNRKSLSIKGEIFLEFENRAGFFLRVFQIIEATEDIESMVLATPMR